MSETNQIEKKRFRLSFFSSMIIILLMWVIHLVNYSTGMELTKFGINPREINGLIGILSAPLLHGDWQHLIANSMSFIVLGTGLFYFYPKIGYKFFGISWILSGLMVWFMARPSYHIGASGLIYSMAGFLFLSGIIRKDFRLMAVSLIIVFMYGSMIWGIFPGQPRISWESHFAGMFIGFVFAWIFKNHGPKRKLYSWELEDDEEDDESIEENYPYYTNYTQYPGKIKITYPERKYQEDEEKKQAENNE